MYIYACVAVGAKCGDRSVNRWTRVFVLVCVCVCVCDACVMCVCVRVVSMVADMAGS